MVFDFSVPVILELIQQHGVLAVVLGMVIEEVLVPIPSPVIPMAAGFLLIETSSLLPAVIQIFFLIALPASIASVLSSYFVFGIAHYGGKPVIDKYGRYLDLSWDEIKHLEDHFDSGHEKYYVALFRAIPIVPLSLISGSAGLFRMDWKEYGIWSFIGMLPRNFVLAFIGWYAKTELGFVIGQIEQTAGQVSSVSKIVAVSVVLIVGLVIAYRKTKDLYRWIIFKTKKD